MGGAGVPVNPEGSAFCFAGDGWSTTPCPGCGRQLEPGQPRATMPKDWRPWHAECWTRYAGNEARCYLCDELHPLPHDGKCLL